MLWNWRYSYIPIILITFVVIALKTGIVVNLCYLEIHLELTSKRLWRCWVCVNSLQQNNLQQQIINQGNLDIFMENVTRGPESLTKNTTYAHSTVAVISLKCPPFRDWDQFSLCSSGPSHIPSACSILKHNVPSLKHQHRGMHVNSSIFEPFFLLPSRINSSSYFLDTTVLFFVGEKWEGRGQRGSFEVFLKSHISTTLVFVQRALMSRDYCWLNISQARMNEAACTFAHVFTNEKRRGLGAARDTTRGKTPKKDGGKASSSFFFPALPWLLCDPLSVWVRWRTNRE